VFPSGETGIIKRIKAPNQIQFTMYKNERSKNESFESYYERELSLLSTEELVQKIDFHMPTLK
jgi:hypothetical protein